MSLFLTDQVALIWGVAAYPLLTISSERAGGSGEEHPMSDFLILPEETSEPVPGPRYRLIGQKPPLKPKEVWAIRTRLQIQGKRRDLALFNLAIDSKLRSCDLVALRVSDVAVGGSIRAIPGGQRVSIPEPAASVSAPLHAPVCPHRE
jgi:integrase